MNHIALRKENKTLKRNAVENETFLDNIGKIFTAGKIKKFKQPNKRIEWTTDR